MNHAASGRSTKTFINERRWQKALADKSDHVFIQFGHNDSRAPKNLESTATDGDFRDYLRQYIDDSRAAGATPILVTPMVRRTFDSEGKLNGNLAPYADSDVLLEGIHIGTVRGQRNRYENAKNIKETDIRIGSFIDEPVNKNR